MLAMLAMPLPAYVQESAGPASSVITPALDAISPANSAAVPAADPAYSWQPGPRLIILQDQARLTLPAEYVYLDGVQARQLLRTLGNPNADDVQAVITGADRDWLSVIRFQKSGYILETGTGNWDQDALLTAIRNGTDQSNQLRRKQQVAELEILGWLEQPSYDARRFRLTWGVAVRNQGEAGTDHAAINYNTFILGREGYFTLNLITGLQQIDKNRLHASQLLAGFDFEEGKRYHDYASGRDAVAPFGLSALISNAAAGQDPAKKPAGSKPFSTVAIAGLASLAILLAAAAGVAGWLFWRKRTQVPLLTPAVDEAE